MNRENLYVIIMAGGVGSRFWPMSRSKFPKQFHDILGRGRTLIQETWDRFAVMTPPENIYIVTNERYKDLVKTQLPLTTDDQILLEPVGRNTAPCIAYACYKINKINPHATFVVAPSDHLIHDEDTFRKLVQVGVDACATEDVIMTLGISPTRPDTGYGYIQYIEDAHNKGYYKVKTFTEKPNLEVARSFLESGDYVWNSGIFLFSGKTILNAFSTYLPEMAELFSSITDSYYTPAEQAAIGETYGVCQNISIDYGIMEKVPNAYVIPASFGWSDLGTWRSVYENTDTKDFYDNAVHGDGVIVYESHNNIINVSSKDKTLIIKGLDNFIVVDTEDALLICPKDEEQSIKEFVAELKARYNERYI
ncbi:MAG: mannose-1-phosphate guanylyltransferase [Bacteroidetes bacterium]|nr:MAG: mannose-1-phosphate guanylyltransferase [Bacteroidota bacterium]